MYKDEKQPSLYTVHLQFHIEKNELYRVQGRKVVTTVHCPLYILSCPVPENLYILRRPVHPIFF